MAGRFGLRRFTWSNPMYLPDPHLDEEYEDVDREKQRKIVKKRKAFNIKAMFASLIVLQILVLAVTIVLLWKALDTSVATKLSESGANWCADEPCDHGVCLEAVDGFYCVCRGGWEGEFCETDVNECKTIGCHPLATCNNTAGSYICECHEGYEGDGIEACTDVDECEDEDICGPNSICTNTIGSYNCSCIEGYRLSNGTECEDINECLTSPCHDFADCTNLPGNYSCACKAQYRGDGKVSCKANSSGDGSKILVAAGNPTGTDRASNNLEVYSLPGGITVRTAESAPNYTYCAQSKNCKWDANYHSIVTGLDLQTWHHVEMNLTAMPIDYMDQWQYRVDGMHTFTGGAYFQTARYDNGWNYEYVNRLKFQPRHANFDASFQGFFFDDIHYGVFDSTSSENVIEEYCVSFEE
ncbi:PREDICTED: fibrillin-1-like [Branchiostoma belcheri]|uniref:Fibrillin-1-like n=1 Tax=Branchiostoma belcheri TaxID=7741 RepID=A0A6P4YAU1_BRABE|nr:PREDICTED: fibrillin-1-like [Branchiostoma belcheri]